MTKNERYMGSSVCELAIDPILKFRDSFFFYDREVLSLLFFPYGQSVCSVRLFPDSDLATSFFWLMSAGRTLFY